MSMIFRSEEKFKLNYSKPISFQITDWRSFDFKREFNPETDKGKYLKEFRVQLFGVTGKGRSISTVLTGFKPFFYVEIPEDWKEAKIEQLIQSINKTIPYYEVKSLISYKIIKMKKFRGFTNNIYYPFIKFEFHSLAGFNKYKRILENDVIVGGKKMQLPLYESNLEPIMRLMHITDIEPAGWIEISKYGVPDDPNSNCQIDIEAHYKYIRKMDSAGIAPLITLSFDIESDSSHGDFPQARKKYTKLATDIINHYQKARSTISKLQKSGDNPVKLEYLTNLIQDKEEYFFRLIEAGFLKETPFRDEEIAFVYTKEGLTPSTKQIKEIIPEVLKICDRNEISIRADRNLKEGVQLVLFRWVNKKNKFNPDEEMPNEKNIFELEDLIRDVSKERKLDYSILYSKVFTKDVCIKLLTNLFDKKFPKVEGDPVIQIASVVYRYGDPGVCYRHIITLDTCDPIEGAEVISCENEADVLLEWAKFINKLDPDIMTGYNIFGFDYSFLYYRAKELGVLSEFSKISRLPDYEATLLEKNLASAALGENTMHFIDMVGRVQIDLLKVIRRDHNLGSYKLDSVAEHFISGKVCSIRKDNPQWIEIKNTVEIDKGNYIIIRQDKDGDKFNRGEKIQVLEKETIDGKDWIKLDIPFESSVLSKKPVWGLGKDDVNYKDIFSLQKTGGSSGRKTIGVYCIQDCVLCIRLIQKLEIISNNIGMANVSIVPFSYIFLRGQGVKIFSLVAKECFSHDFLIPVLKTKSGKLKNNFDNEEVSSKEDEIRKLLNALDEDGNDDNGNNGHNGHNVHNLDDNEDHTHKHKNNHNDNDEDGVMHYRRGGGDGDYQIGLPDNTGAEYAGMGDDDDGYEGAIVLQPRPGIYLNEPVSVLDYGSLYPSSMISENLSHDSIVLDPAFDNLPGYTYGEVTYDIKKWIDPNKKSLGKHTVGQKTCRFVNFPDDANGKPVKGIIPLILQKLLAARKFYKKKKDADPDPFKKTVWEGLQLAYKVTANSLYGQIGAKTSPIYLKDVAASTTATGRGLLTFARDFVLANFEGAQIIYGDSVIGATPLLLRNSQTKQIYIESINNLATDSNYNNLNRTDGDEKESCELDNVETWTEQGWTKVQRVIRHKLAPEKKLFRITTHTGSVVVTDDHSLLNINGEKISPKDIKIGDELLHSFPDINANKNNNKNNNENNNDYDCNVYNLKNKVPEFILNASKEIREKFLLELFDINKSNTYTGMVLALGIYTLCKSLGYEVSIYTNLEDLDMYKINIHTIHNNLHFDFTKNKIKKIEEWNFDEEYVYDLTTDNHHFQAGVGSLIVHNTDSIFIKFKLEDENGNTLTGIPALQKSIDTGLHAEHLIQRYLKPPHVLEYEKTFWPFILFTKKRYVGNLYETDVNEFKQKSMGIVLKRRDNAPIVKYVYGGIIDSILNKKSLELSIDFLKQSLIDLIEGKFDIQMLVISKTLRSTYKDPESIAHKVLADRMGERDPGNKPQANDRIPYVYIKVKTNGPKDKILQGDKIEHVNYVREQKLKPDYLTYLENQIKKPVSQIYELAVSKLPGYNKDADYFVKLEFRYNDKYSDKSIDFIQDKIQQAKEKEVEALLFQDALRKARNQKANLQEISNWLVLDNETETKDTNSGIQEIEEIEETKETKTELIKPSKKIKKEEINEPKKRVNRSITDWLI
jgi:DNA polymerase elongation subunit (family B)